MTIREAGADASASSDRSIPQDPISARLAAENVALRAELEELRANLELIVNSTTWRVTAPLRRLADLRRRFTAGGAGLDGGAYRRWRATHQDLTPDARRAAAAHVGRMIDPPLLSLLLRVGDHPVRLIETTIRSLGRQIYPHWEACVVDDGATDPAIARLLATAARDERVRLLRRDGGGTEAEAVEAAWGLATGSHAALLACGDRLAPSALYEAAAALERAPDADLVYGDDDEIDARGRHLHPRFKSGWSPELLLEQDFLTGIALFRRDRIAGCGGLGEGARALALRLTRKADPVRVVHVPAILAHRQAATPAEIRIPVGDPPEWPAVTVIIPIRDRPELLQRCADGLLRRTDYPRLDVIVADNGSADPRTHALLESLRGDSRVAVMAFTGAFNWSSINNAAAARATGEVLLLLNNDIDVMSPGWLREMVRHAVRPDIGAVGAKLLFADGRVQHAGIWLGPELSSVRHPLRLARRDDPGYLGQLSLTRNMSAVTGACLAVRRRVFEEVGGLDPAFAVSCNDIDFCLRVRRAGYRVVWTPHAELTHLESATRGSLAPAEAAERAEFARRWGEQIRSDRFFNPNLDLIGEETLTLARPPRRIPPWAAPPQTASPRTASLPAAPS